jgi:hypothetical protein
MQARAPYVLAARAASSTVIDSKHFSAECGRASLYGGDGALFHKSAIMTGECSELHLGLVR